MNCYNKYGSTQIIAWSELNDIQAAHLCTVAQVVSGQRSNCSFKYLELSGKELSRTDFTSTNIPNSLATLTNLTSAVSLAHLIKDPSIKRH